MFNGFIRRIANMTTFTNISDIINLTLQSDYRRQDKILIGNGVVLHISHIGSSSISIHTGTFLLSNMLHVPNKIMIVNLIYLHSFAFDNNCLFELDAFDFCVKNKAIEKMPFREQNEIASIPFLFMWHLLIPIKQVILHFLVKMSRLLFAIRNLDIQYL